MHKLKALIRGWLSNWVSQQALQHGKHVGLFLKLVRPDGVLWASYLKRHGGLYAMGDFCSVQTNVTITDPAYTRLGNNVRLSGCTLFGHDGSVNMLKRAYGVQLDRVGKVDILDNVFIGHQAIVLPGVTIGPNAIVAAGSVVTKDVPPDSVVAGSPARVVGKLSERVEAMQEKTRELPWADYLPKDPFDCPPADAKLNALRQAEFFGKNTNVT